MFFGSRRKLEQPVLPTSGLFSSRYPWHSISHNCWPDSARQSPTPTYPASSKKHAASLSRSKLGRYRCTLVSNRTACTLYAQPTSSSSWREGLAVPCSLPWHTTFQPITTFHTRPLGQCAPDYNSEAWSSSHNQPISPRELRRGHFHADLDDAQTFARQVQIQDCKLFLSFGHWSSRSGRAGD